MRIPATAIAGFSLLLLALPAGAQPTAPASPSTAAPQESGTAGMMGGMGMMSGQGRGGMGMMMGPGAMGGGGEDEDDGDRGPMHRWRHGPDRRETPMQIIINIGPDNRVETEEHAWGGPGVGRPGWRMMGGEWRGRSMVEHVDADLRYLHDQLQLTSEQQPAWDRFAGTVREAVARLHPGQMTPGQSLEQRLAAHESLLNSLLEATRAIRSALSGLTGSLDDAQKHILDEVTAALMARAAGMWPGWQ